MKNLCESRIVIGFFFSCLWVIGITDCIQAQKWWVTGIVLFLTILVIAGGIGLEKIMNPSNHLDEIKKPEATAPFEENGVEVVVFNLPPPPSFIHPPLRGEGGSITRTHEIR